MGGREVIVLVDASRITKQTSITYMFLGASSNSGWLYFFASSRSITAWSGWKDRKTEAGEV